MLVFLARYPKAIAWFCTALIYLELILLPVGANAAGRPLPVVVKGPPAWQGWLAKQSAASMASPGASVTPVPPAVQLRSLRNEVPRAIAVGMEKKDAPFIGGPGQPEMQAFSSVNNANMVDLFSGDFSYNIPLLDVGGYPVSLGYRAGVSMDQEASWVGLGWNVNPGTISRNLRGLPDDFDGDSIRKVQKIKENKTVGVTGEIEKEIAGRPEKRDKKKDSSGLKFGLSLGVMYNNYRGWGVEVGFNPSINVGKWGGSSLTAGLSVTSSSMDGFGFVPSLTFGGQLDKLGKDEKEESGGLSVSLPYNSRSGIKSLQLSLGTTQQYKKDANNQFSVSGSFSSSLISFARSSYTPTIKLPYTSSSFSFEGKVGIEKPATFNNFALRGYVATQGIDPRDTVLALPSYGYLNYQHGAQNLSALLDFNREAEIAYRDKPAIPHIAVPNYTYDAFSITGEGTGGMFRAYRGDIGFIYDHAMGTRDKSTFVGVEIGLGDKVHAGLNINRTRAYTHSGPWLDQNIAKDAIRFRQDSGLYQSVYFRNPGEKSINAKGFYETLGGDDVVTFGLTQEEKSAVITANNFLTRYRNYREVGKSLLTPQNTIKPDRDKRTQVISYLTAKEADGAALSKYIETYSMNVFDAAICADTKIPVEGVGHGIPGHYYKNLSMSGDPDTTIPNQKIILEWKRNEAPPGTGWPHENIDFFSISWVGRFMAPQTGSYSFGLNSDDGSRLKINGKVVVEDWRDRSTNNGFVRGEVNLVGGEFYDIEVDMFDHWEDAALQCTWNYRRPDGTYDEEEIPIHLLYPPAVDTFAIRKNNEPTGTLLGVREKRVNSFRKAHHLSEISVLNNDGRRYIYGIPVYNLKQKEATFAVNGRLGGDRESNLVKYTHGIDNTVRNEQGNDRYFTSEEVPAYAHSFLLTGILSADYSDITGNGISDDDIGDAVKFNYTRIRGIRNPFRWRAPYVTDPGNASLANFNEGLRTDYRDDKGSYVYGEKELWYLHTIESKTMVATFVLEAREDLKSIDERGTKTDGSAKRLKEINLYSKSDFAQKGTAARPIKTVHFRYSYKLCPGINGGSTAKLTLDSLWFTYNGNKKGPAGVNPYVFRYNSLNPAYNIKSYDRWGNYKDPLQNPGSKSGDIINNAEYPYALQDSATAARNAAAWTLDSILLPSGGSIKVDYESDDYAYVQNKRAMQLFKIVGLDTSTTLRNGDVELYNRSKDKLYVFIKVPKQVTKLSEVYTNYLAGIEKLYFRLHVEMEGDNYSNGRMHEFVSCYADLEQGPGAYGIASPGVIWVKLKGIGLDGTGGGSYSPLAKAATQFLRVNLPSKAYPGSETGDELELDEAIKMLASTVDNIVTAFRSFDAIARNRSMARKIDTSRSFVRLTNPYFKKYGGGHRVKRVTIYDNWNKMTNQRAATYGQEYRYTTTQEIDGIKTSISSGVASYEPGLGGDENPFRLPIEYLENITALGPVTLGYTEEPLGESFFPAPGVGYSCVSVRTIHHKNKKSANGYDETKFYTAYDYPVYTERTLLDPETKKRFKPDLANFLKINARHYLGLTQGFKVELNDMHGKFRSKASYPEVDTGSRTSFTEHYYKTDNSLAANKRLVNTVMVMQPDGIIDSAALIGKDVELMVDMREHKSVTNGFNLPLNSDMFQIPGPPGIWILLNILNMAQREETRFRSVATVKIIQRYGILDSVVVVDKGSRISTQDLMYDSETGDVLLTRTQNEFNDPVFNFSYPSHWAYDGMGPAYKNIGVQLNKVNIRDGKIDTTAGVVNRLFTSGDEILVGGSQKTGGSDCAEVYATFPNFNKVWCIDSSVLTGGPSALYFIDRSGKPYSAFNVSMKVIRSGRRNIFGAVGSVTSLDSLVRRDPVTGRYALQVNTQSKIIAAASNEFRQDWKVEDIQAPKQVISCLASWRPTGGHRCMTATPGGTDTTGYQEIEIIDVNPYSDSIGIKRWVLYGLNCLECPRPAKWIAIGDSCVKDQNNQNTGYKLARQRDTANCSRTFNEIRYQPIGLDCSTCAAPAKWVNAGDSCLRDANGFKTGYKAQKELDTARCSSSYNTIRLGTSVLDCGTCKPAAKRVYVGDSCLRDANGFKTGYKAQKLLDTAKCSDTYNSITLGTQVLDCAGCKPAAKWAYIGDSCLLDGNNLKTGYKRQKFLDTAQCSDTYNSIELGPVVLDCSGCRPAAKWFQVGDSCLKDGSGKNTGYRAPKLLDTAACSLTYNTISVGSSSLNCAICPNQAPNWVATATPQRCEGGGGSTLRASFPTGYLEQEYIDISTCSDSSGRTKWVRTVLDCTSCPGGSSCPTCDPGNCSEDVGRKCIEGICRTGVTRCTESILLPSGLYQNTYRYYWVEDGSYSSYNYYLFESTECFPIWPGLINGELNHKTGQATDRTDDDSYSKTAQNNTDRFYRSILPRDKYILYKERQKGLSENLSDRKNGNIDGQ